MKKLNNARLIKVACVTAAAFLPFLARAQDNPKFPANQLTLDGFATYHQFFPNFGSQFDHNWRHGTFGGGAGVDYFFLPYVGLGVDSFGDSKGDFFDNVTGNVYLRLPVAQTGFAPYIYGGAGEVFHPTGEITEDCGVGLEYRFSRRIGVFSDVRYIFEKKTEDSNLVRLGLKFGL